MKTKFQLTCIIFFSLLFLDSGQLFASRIYGGYYTKDRIANLRANCERYDWARKQKESVVKHAAQWIAKTDEELWGMVPGQDLPRCIDVTFDRLTKGPKFLGCLKCGHAIAKYGNYPYNPDFEHKPWKLTCPSCKAVFPTNDFEKYYKSAIDEKGLFNPQKGDRSLLFNAAHPDPKDPLHKYGVDDGFGYINEDGRGFRFVGYYVWKYWGELIRRISVLADAYVYTGEQIYARKAAIMLDRIADVYPDMDWKPYADQGWYHSDGNNNKGKIEGSIWETSVVRRLADSYDKILSGTVGDQQLYSFLKKQSEKYKLPTQKGNRDLFVANVDEGLLRTAYRAVLAKQIRGNEGMHQLAVARCAIALNTMPETEQWLDWIFKPDGGAIPGLMIRSFDRDGTSDEGAPSYAFMWGQLVTDLGALLSDYPQYTKHNIFNDYPQFSATFLTAYRMAVLGIATPNIGDSGSTGSVVNAYVDPQFIARGFRYTRDPRMAIAAYQSNGNSAKGLGINIFSKDPEQLSKEIENLAKGAAGRENKGYMMTGFGMAVLESGSTPESVAIVSNYGRTIRHAHPDMLNFDILAFGKWLAPDHGYPEYATRWPSNNEWTGSTLSHNLVYVNKQPQKEIWGGHTELFKHLKGFGAFEIDGRKAYPDIKDYRRTMLLVGGSETDSNAYVVDIFRVLGGQDHVYSFHGPPGTVLADGLNLVEQRSGTYAGEDIAKAAWSNGFPIGYSHLYNVTRDRRPADQFMLEWKAEAGYRGLKTTDDIRLRMHVLSPSDDVTMADGDPPQNKPGNPKTLRYALLHRAGEELHSNFVSVFEPYRNKPFIKSVKRLQLQHPDQIALQVEKLDGTTDYLLYNLGDKQISRLPNGIRMDGKLGYLTVNNDLVQRAVLVNGETLSYKSMVLKGAQALEGKVVKMNKDVKGPGWILVDTPLPTDGSLTGEQIIMKTPHERDATYTIERVEKEGARTKVYCGPITFVRTYRVKKEASAPTQAMHYLFDFEEGTTFKITNHKTWEKTR